MFQQEPKTRSDLPIQPEQRRSKPALSPDPRACLFNQRKAEARMNYGLNYSPQSTDIIPI